MKNPNDYDKVAYPVKGMGHDLRDTTKVNRILVHSV